MPGIGDYSVGKTMVVRLASDLIASMTDWTLTINRKEISLSCLGDDWDTFAVGSGDWSFSGNAILDMTDTNGQYDIVNEVLSGDGVLTDPVLMYSYDGGTSDGYFKGSAVVTSVNPSNPGNNDVMRLAFTLRGTGAITWTAGT